MTYLQKFRASAANRALQRILRVFQFLSPVISLGFFTSSIVKILRLGQKLNKSTGAVEGILAAAILYTIIAMIITFALKHGAPKPIRWLLVLFDLIFLGAFIGVAYLTRPQGAARPKCNNTGYTRVLPGQVTRHENCNLPWATFILAIVSTILHLLTALFHEVRDHHKNKHASDHPEVAENNRNGQNGGW